MEMNIPRIVVAGTGSGVGKTTVTLGLILALRKAGLKVSSFKCGPDYLDPTYLSRATGSPCHNLDGWLMGKEALLKTFIQGAQGTDIAVIEGVMGLHDGLSPTSDVGSTAEVAKWLEAPVLLVMDAKGMARTAAALAKGMSDFDPLVKLQGVVANFVGSEGHLKLLSESMGTVGLPLLGGLPKSPEQAFPERHLGLVGAQWGQVPQEQLEFWGELCGKWIDLEGILELARKAGPLSLETSTKKEKMKRTCRIGIARDEAFHFYYEDNLQRLADLGAELVFFSPLRDKHLPEVDGLYLGGGYPELFAEYLSSNKTMMEGIRKFVSEDGPVYAECGGLMYLAEGIFPSPDEDTCYPLVGIIPGMVKMGRKLKALGYVEVSTESETPLGAAGLRFRGHQFRYSELVLDAATSKSLQLQFRLRSRRSKETVMEGYAVKRVLASYVHAHWASNPLIAENFVNACSGWRHS